MATYYVPNETGWTDTGILGNAAQMRLKLDRSYNASANRSTLTVTLQCRSPNYGGRYLLLNNALVKLNDTVLINGGGNATGALNAYVDLNCDTAWHNLVDSTSGQTLSWTATVNHAADGKATATLSVKVRLYRNDSYYLTFYDLSGSQTMNETRQFTLSISAGTGSTITVKRSGTTLTNGATLTYGDQLTISFGAQTGYNLATHTVNGSTFPSGGSHTVTGAVSVVSTAAKRTYTLSISAGTGSIITVKRSGTTLTNGATLTHGDTLTISFAAASGYELLTHTVNGSAFTSGGGHTVTGAVAVAASARRLGLLRLDTGSAVKRYRLLLDTGSAIVPVRIFLDRGDRITEAGI